MLALPSLGVGGGSCLLVYVLWVSWLSSSSGQGQVVAGSPVAEAAHSERFVLCQLHLQLTGQRLLTAVCCALQCKVTTSLASCPQAARLV